MRRLAILLALLPLAGCGSGDERSSAPEPRRFSTTIDNPYLPMVPGSRWVYRNGAERIVVAVTHRTRRIANGVTARVVRDTAREHGMVVEDTFDWYAQDQHGNVWYLGEDTTAYERGKPSSKEGSWEAGVRGAKPGIVMLAHPRVGMRYRQEYLKGVAEDKAEVLSLDERATVPFGTFDGVLTTKDFNPLEPGVVEHKYYAEGVGEILALKVKGGSEREELVSYREGDPP